MFQLNSFSFFLSLREKCPNTELFLVRIFLYFSYFPNTRKCGPEITPSLDTFHAVCHSRVMKIRTFCIINFLFVCVFFVFLFCFFLFFPFYSVLYWIFIFANLIEKTECWNKAQDSTKNPLVLIQLSFYIFILLHQLTNNREAYNIIFQYEQRLQMTQNKELARRVN